jgi:Spy/CpxP family protein refolding chaperone
MKLSLCFALAVLCSILTTPCRSWQADSREFSAVKAGGTPYFTAKMENLTTKLELTPDQQAKLKPIAEQEVGLLEQIRGISGLSQKEKLSRLQRIVMDSDKQMKPMLSPEQWQKLKTLRKDQKEQLKQYAKTN